MIFVAWRIAGPDALTPWRSELLRWRIETFGFLDEAGQPLEASHITPRRCIGFLVERRQELSRFLRWAARLSDSP